MQKNWAMALGAFFGLVIGSSCGPTEEWEKWSCQDAGYAISKRVDECLPVITTCLSVIDEPGDVLNYWNDLEVCKHLAEPDGSITPETLQNVRVCGHWLVNPEEHSCEDLCQAFQDIIVLKKKDFGQPPECKPLVDTLRQIGK